jgi:hypothetical protein
MRPRTPNPTRSWAAAMSHPRGRAVGTDPGVRALLLSLPFYAPAPEPPPDAVAGDVSASCPGLQAVLWFREESTGAWLPCQRFRSVRRLYHGCGERARVHSCHQEKGAESSLLRPGTGACAHKIPKASETLSVCTRYGRADSNLGPLGLSELGVQTQVKAIAAGRSDTIDLRHRGAAQGLQSDGRWPPVRTERAACAVARSGHGSWRSGGSGDPHGSLGRAGPVSSGWQTTWPGRCQQLSGRTKNRLTEDSLAP